MKKRKQKRWTSEEQVLEAIKSSRELQKLAIYEADELRRSASAFTKLNQPGLREEIADRREKADKAVERAERYESKIVELGRKLAQFRTELLPLDGNTDRAVA